jgi:DNA processing protein
MTACDGCLRRGDLLGFLAEQIAGRLDRPRDSAAGLLALPEDELIAAAGGKRRREAREFVECWRPGASRARIASAGLSAVCRHDDLYPGSLLVLPDPPSALYSTAEPGRLARLLEEPAVAVVGTRMPSPYGLEVAAEIGRGLSAAGLTVVSGLALGIDAAAHAGAVEAGGRGIAVLATGADSPYPRRNAWLYRRLAERGAVVSEMPPGSRTFRWAFPARNRIMAGLSELTVVVEAAVASGSLITAEFAQSLGRDVAAVPGRVTARNARGSNRLLSEGAALVTGAGDVLELVLGVGHDRAVTADPDLDPVAERILLAVESGVAPASLGSATGLDRRQVRAALGRLELAGLVVRDPLGSYERAGAR